MIVPRFVSPLGTSFSISEVASPILCSNDHLDGTTGPFFTLPSPSKARGSTPAAPHLGILSGAPALRSSCSMRKCAVSARLPMASASLGAAYFRPFTTACRSSAGTGFGFSPNRSR
jgi:hypothetical protein